MKLHEREYEFACIVWDNEPLSSRALARLEDGLEADDDIHRAQKAL